MQQDSVSEYEALTKAWLIIHAYDRRMLKPEWLPAMIIMTSLAVGLASLRYLPLGEATVLARVPLEDGAAARAAAMSNALLVGIPGPGLALLHGNTSMIRNVVGLAAVWKGLASCRIHT